MPFLMQPLDTAEREALLAGEAGRRRLPRRELRAAAESLGAISLPEGQRLAVHRAEWYLLVPEEAR